jgi:hypothetical protein
LIAAASIDGASPIDRSGPLAARTCFAPAPRRAHSDANDAHTSAVRRNPVEIMDGIDRRGDPGDRPRWITWAAMITLRKTKRRKQKRTRHMSQRVIFRYYFDFQLALFCFSSRYPSLRVINIHFLQRESEDRHCRSFKSLL